MRNFQGIIFKRIRVCREVFKSALVTASFYRFQVLEKQKLIMTNSQTDQVTWVGPAPREDN